MLDLLIATLEMMGFTFVIGFFVAFIIKMIAVAANSFDFYSSHQKELLRLRRLRKLRQKVGAHDTGYPYRRKMNSITINAKNSAAESTVSFPIIVDITME